MFSLPAEFSVLKELLSSEDEILVGNAALCLGNCMEVPQAASSLLKTDIVQVLLKLAGGDAQKTAVQLNAGIALGKMCTAEPRYEGVARVSHISEQAGQAQPRRHAVARTLPRRTLWGAQKSWFLLCRQVLGPSSCSSGGRLPRGTWEPSGSAQREGRYLFR